MNIFEVFLQFLHDLLITFSQFLHKNGSLNVKILIPIFFSNFLQRFWEEYFLKLFLYPA